MAHHNLPATPETVAWGYFDAARAPVLEIDSGDTVTFETLSGEPEDMPPAGFEILPEHPEVHQRCERGRGPHFLTGPVFVRGAQPGDVLEVRILSCELRQSWGWNVVEPLLGTLPEDFPERRLLHMPIDIAAGTVKTPWGKTLPLDPFFGIYGVAPPAAYGRIGTAEPREHGGNMDNKELKAGTTLFLPVWNEGALFSTGDGHGVQGDGEVCLTALETAMRGTFEFHLRKDMTLSLPRAETASEIITMAFDPDLDDAAKTALRQMIDLLATEHGMDRRDAYTLCSLAADMRVTQLVDGNKGIHTVLPKSAIGRD
ncbi:acetamidase/formamidase family protein [Acuticoccus sp. MNP-M23]|uniref:acetamidase/formamidase family protein n=1 Tax=Acuticoccus sp. MNP-M23 TaxID=3072793 RepID=UPI0028151AE1|nr:acetamidase/formamidase family protein [Acuticoccus sp. MNP-M23]WMS42298.1 acetamidase/formamidase family protein [Acuticoccus sp. MNP-M23]